MSRRVKGTSTTQVIPCVHTLTISIIQQITEDYLNKSCVHASFIYKLLLLVLDKYLIFQTEHL